MTSPGTLVVLLSLSSAASVVQPAPAPPVRSTEDFLNTLGVNTHIGGLPAPDTWNTDAQQVGAQLRYLGVRLVRDWPYAADLGKKLADMRSAWQPEGRFWLSVVEGSPTEQRQSVVACAAIAKTYPGMVYAVGGGNEEDDDYAQKRGATLPDTAKVQALLYESLHPLGILVSQSEFGAGWTAANGWNGDYNPTNTGIHQNYVPGPADVGGAHTYLIQPKQRMGDVLADLRRKARLCTPGKPVAHTEVGAYFSYKQPPEVFGQTLVMGALDSFAAGDTGYIMYGLQDSAPESTYGFFAFPGGAVHPAARYYHTMTTLLQSTSGRYAPGAKPTFRPAPLAATFSNPGVNHLVLQKPVGEYVIAEWSEQAEDASAHQERDSIAFGRTFTTVAVYDVEQGLKPIATAQHASRYTLQLTPNHTYLIVLK